MAVFGETTYRVEVDGRWCIGNREKVTKFLEAEWERHGKHQPTDGIPLEICKKVFTCPYDMQKITDAHIRARADEALEEAGRSSGRR